MYLGIRHWASRALWLLGFLVVLGAQYVRQLSIEPGPLHDWAVFLLGFTDSREDQSLTAICLVGYLVGLGFCRCVLTRRLGGGCHPVQNAATPGWWCWTAVLLLALVGWAGIWYVADYGVAYPRSDFITFVAAAAMGQAAALLGLRRGRRQPSGSFDEAVLPCLLAGLTVVALLRPEMGKDYEYRGHVRWLGPYFNPNIFGMLMGTGVVLALGGLIQSGSSVQCGVARAEPPSLNAGSWIGRLFLLAAAGVSGLALVRSYSRGAWVAAGAGAAYLILNAEGRMKNEKEGTARAGSGMGNARALTAEILKRVGGGRVLGWVRRHWVALAVICASVGVMAFWSLRYSKGVVAQRAFSVTNANDFSWRKRLAAYEGALQMLADKPWSGFGWNQPEPVYSGFYRPPKVDEGLAIESNDYFVLGTTLGLPALVCFTVYAGLCLAGRPSRALPGSGEATGNWLRVTCRAGAIVLLTGFWFDGGLFKLATGGICWILLELGREDIASVSQASPPPSRRPQRAAWSSATEGLGPGGGAVRPMCQTYATWPQATDAGRGAGAVLGAALCLPLVLASCGERPGVVDYPGARWFPRLADGGFSKGRGARKIDLVILYTTEHPADYAQKYWRESDSLSGHYIVTAEGEVWQFVRERDTAWHAGNREFNLRSVGIAVEGYADPGDAQNPSKGLSWPTGKEMESLARLLRSLSERYTIPIDRAHIIGKNQVPGVRTDAFPLSGPQFWGGASNKSSPGAYWDWGRLMEKLGREPVWRSLSVLTNCAIRTLPQAGAPTILCVSAGRELQAYDSYGGYWLVLVSGEELPQPYLPSGRYHWDGWIEKKFVNELSTADSDHGRQ
jgi:O-antigen ligase